MNRGDAFYYFHPAVNFLYFAVVLIFSMFTMHPVCLAISFICSSLYYARLKGGKAALSFLCKTAPLFLITVIINPTLNHRGATKLFTLPTGKPFTLESFLYGVAAGIMMISLLLWFACLSEELSSDKFIYLFGKTFPSLSLLLTLTLRFIPLFGERFIKTAETQKALGRDISNGAFIKRMKNAVACFSVTVTWCLENAVRTADSMKSRGYGTGKRGVYSHFKLRDEDKTALVFISACALFLLSASVSGATEWSYLPSTGGRLTEKTTAGIYAVYFILCIYPLLTDKKEERIWKRLSSGI